ncbi:MAG TPA: SLATT domain-containing protein [Acidimicrobiales bacterium]
MAGVEKAKRTTATKAAGSSAAASEPDGKADGDVVRLFDPTDATELLRGWQLHVARRRTVHEASARRLQRWNQWLGVPTTVFAAAAGTSAFAAGQAANGSSQDVLAIAGLVVGAAAAVTSHLSSSLNLGARAEAHRQAAGHYKQLLRSFERLAPDGGRVATDVLTTLENRLSEVDAGAPIVPKRLAQQEERKKVVVVTQAIDLASGR